MQRLAVMSGVVFALVLGVGATPVWAGEIVGNGGFEVAGAGGAADSAMWNEGAGAARYPSATVHSLSLAPGTTISTRAPQRRALR